MRDIVCQYRGTLIPLLKNWGIFRVVVRAQVVHRVIFTTFTWRNFVTQPPRINVSNCLSVCLSVCLSGIQKNVDFKCRNKN